jgi:PadR family transcriptional regulator PadR
VKSSVDLLQGTLDLLILKAVSLGGLHGYGVLVRLRQLTGGRLQIQQGSLYPALYRLELQGWMKADWRQTETGRQAKFYSLTRAGERRLEKELANWDRLSSAINLVVRST